MKVYDYGGSDWEEFISAMHSGEPVAVTDDMYDYWLEVLPPVYLKNPVTLPTGKQVRSDFGFVEGADYITAFWREGEQAFCCRTNQMHRGY